jgi:hypothetical protein
MGGDGLLRQIKKFLNERNCLDGLEAYFKFYSRGVQPAARQVVLRDPGHSF